MPVVVNHEELRELSQALYEAAGTPSDHATIVVSHQVGANLKGHDSHGVVLLPTYLSRIDRGHIMPNAKPEVMSESPTTIQVKRFCISPPPFRAVWFASGSSLSDPYRHYSTSGVC